LSSSLTLRPPLSPLLPYTTLFRSLTVYLACGGETRNVHDLITKLLNSHDCLAEWIYNIPAAMRLVTAYNPKFSAAAFGIGVELGDRKSTRLNSSHVKISYAVFCLK